MVETALLRKHKLVRIDPDLHARIKTYVRARGLKLEWWLNDRISKLPEMAVRTERKFGADKR